MSRALAAVALALLLALGAGAARATTITIVNLDGPGEGFNDATPVAPEGGNTGTTRGAQRLQLFQAAANQWAARISSSVAIKVGANFDPLTPCSPSGGVLGGAGADSVFQLTSPPAGYQANTWYSVAEAESVTGTNLNGTENEIDAQFNSSVDTGCLGAGTRFWYGTTSPSPDPNKLNLMSVLLHELGHGLGFLSLVCVDPAGCGGGSVQGALLSGNQDIWNFFLRDGSNNLLWKDMTNGQRAASMKNNQHLVWNGANVTAGIGTYQPGGAGVDPSTGRVKMYAPTSVQIGSTVSHFDVSATSPDLLMEPAIDTDFNDLDLTVPLLKDIGWVLSSTVNQAPSVAAPSSIAVTEDVATALTGISFSDPDAGGGSLTATFTVASGALDSPACSGVTAGGTATARTLAGTLANLNACLVGSHLHFTTATDATGSVALAISINDNGNTGSGGAKTGSGNATLTVTAVNDAPTLSAPASIAVTEDVATALTAISFADVDAGASTITANFSVGSGTLAAAASPNVSASGTTTNVTLTGTVANLDSYFAAGMFTFKTAANATGDVSLAITLNDQGHTGSGGAKTASGTVTITVSAVNDAPTIAAPASIAVTEDVSTALTSIGVADVDSGSGNVQLTLTVDSGALAAAPSPSVTASGPSNAIVLTGTVANLNAYFAAGMMTFRTATNATAPVTLGLALTDNGNTGSGGAKTASASVTLNVTAVNDAPVLGAASTFAVTEDVATALTAITTSDVDAGSAALALNLQVGSGTLAAAADPNVTSSGVATNLTLSGSASALGAYLAGGGLTYRTASNATADVTLMLSLNDNGNTGSGGAKTATATATINVAAVNDAPTLAASARIEATAPGLTAIGGIVPGDIDAGGGTLDLTLAVDAGTLAALPGGGVSVAGSGTATLDLSGTLSNLAAYVAAGNVQFIAAGALPGDIANLHATLDDNGNTGSGGARSASADTVLDASLLFRDGFE